ncbi:MAG: phage tail tube protein [Patescibacteria group bacterium]|nr:phage tail tube protein [Patescibacteria group bacterium]
MSTQIGRRIQVGLAKETTRGTAEASATYWLPKVDFDFKEIAEYAVDESGIGQIEARKDAEVVKQLGEGSFGGIIYDRPFGLLLGAALGTWSSGDVADSSYTHTFTVLNTNQHPALTLFPKDANIDEKHALGMLSQLTINCALEDYVRYNVGFISKMGASTSSTPSYSTDDLSFLAQHITVKFADSIAALGTASESTLRNVNLTINKNPEAWMSLGDKEPTDIPNKQFSVSGDLEAIFDDTIYRDYVIDGSQKACEIAIENTDETIGTSSNPKLTFTLAPMNFRDWGRGTGQDDITTQTVAFDGNFSLSQSKMIEAELVNTVESY